MEAYKEIQVTSLIDFREKVDGLMTLMIIHPLVVDFAKFRAIGKFPGEPYNRCHTSLSLAKAWMGKAMESLGTETPYKNDGKRDTIADIEPTADTHAVLDAIIKEYPDTKYPLTKAFIVLEKEQQTKAKGFTYFSDLSAVQKVDWLREQTKKVKLDFLKMPPLTGPKARICINNVYTHLTEARMHLGFQLQEYKELSELTDNVFE